LGATWLRRGLSKLGKHAEVRYLVKQAEQTQTPTTNWRWQLKAVMSLRESLDPGRGTDYRLVLEGAVSGLRDET